MKKLPKGKTLAQKAKGYEDLPRCIHGKPWRQEQNNHFNGIVDMGFARFSDWGYCTQPAAK